MLFPSRAQAGKPLQLLGLANNSTATAFFPMTIQKPMTLQKAKSIARHLGLTLRQLRSGNYRVNFRDGNETTAYYTDKFEDAVNALVAMARKRAFSSDCRADSAPLN